MLAIDCSAVKAVLIARADDLVEKLRLAVKSAFVGKGTELCGRYMDIFVRLGNHPTTEEEMVSLEAFLVESAELLANLNSELNEARKSLRFLTEQAVSAH